VFENQLGQINAVIGFFWYGIVLVMN